MFDSDVHAYRTASPWEGFWLGLDLEACVPLARSLALDDDRFYFAIDFTMELDGDFSNFRKGELSVLELEPRLVKVEGFEPTLALETKLAYFPPFAFQPSQSADIRPELVVHHLQNF